MVSNIGKMITNRNQNNFLMRFIVLIALVVSIAILIILSENLITPEQIAGDDFSLLWIAGSLNLQGENPYNGQNILFLRSALTGGLFSWKPTELVLLYPPWVLTIISPFTLFTYRISRLFWLLFNVCIILFGSSILWKIYKPDNKRLPLSWLIAFTFFPTVLVFEKGQVTPIILLSIVGFLYASHQRKDFLSGVFAGLAIIKPHLVYLFLVALFLWIFLERKWRVLLGFILVMLIFSVIPVLTNPSIYYQYIFSIAESSDIDWATPTLGTGLRIIMGIEKKWLKLIPPIFGIIWLLSYSYQRRNWWNWIRRIPIIIAFSLTTTYFAWIYDSVLLIITIIPGIVCLYSMCNRSSNQKYKLIFPIMLTFYILADIAVLFVYLINREYFFILFPPIILIWFLFSVRPITTSPKPKEYNLL